MIIIKMQPDASIKDLGAVTQYLESHNLEPHIARGQNFTHVGSIEAKDEHIEPLKKISGVVDVVKAQGPYRLGSKELFPETSTINIRGAVVGGKEFTLMCGPCAVESHEQITEVSKVLHRLNIPFLRGGAFKPRTSPYSFQGHGKLGLELLYEARERWGLRIVTECLTPHEVELVAQYADVVQVGARNMQNFALLQELGRHRIPVLLKRGMMNSIQEFLLSAEYILSNGNMQVMLCERGIRTFETATRNTLDISAVAVLKEHTHLPVIIDPSHAAGDRRLVPSMALAAVAAGADGLIMEVHPNPDEAISDGPQSLTLEQLEDLVPKIERVAEAVGRTLPHKALNEPVLQNSLP